MKLINSELKQKILVTLCDLRGHIWRYKYYHNCVKSNGEPYEFNASRKCTRCGQYSYHYSSWVNQIKNTSFGFERASEQFGT